MNIQFFAHQENGGGFMSPLPDGRLVLVADAKVSTAPRLSLWMQGNPGLNEQMPSEATCQAFTEVRHLIEGAPDMRDALRDLLDALDDSGSCAHERLRAAGRSALRRAGVWK